MPGLVELPWLDQPGLAGVQRRERAQQRTLRRPDQRSDHRRRIGAGADVLGFDWRLPIGDAVARAGQHAVQGNIDPLALFLPKERLEERIQTMLTEARDANGYIFNLGHGILPETPPEQVRIAVDAVHRFSGKP